MRIDRLLVFVPVLFALNACSSDSTSGSTGTDGGTDAAGSRDSASGTNDSGTNQDSGNSADTGGGQDATADSASDTGGGNDSGANDGSADASLACQAYCTCMASTCSSQAPAGSGCLAACASQTTWDLNCRVTHCGYAANDPTTHCPHAGGVNTCQ